MSLIDSPEIMATRLESRIDRSESNSRLLINQVETKLNDRIHELEMKLIRRGVFSWPDLDTVLRWMVILWFTGILFCLFVSARSAPAARKSDDVPTTSQNVPAQTTAPQETQPQDKSDSR